MERRRPVAELVSLGNELLIGRTVNTNASFIAKHLTEAGMDIRRSTTLPDDLELSAAAFKEIASREPDIVVITGGLGPTWDDKQIQILAEGLGIGTELNETALEWIRVKYDALGLPMNDARKKMANLPAGSTPLFNGVGTAPAYELKHGRTTWFGLPGIPSEMEDIIINQVMPLISKLTEGLEFHQLFFTVIGVPESSLAPLISQSVESHPLVYIKSHPYRSEGHMEIVLHLTSFDSDGNALVKRAAEELREHIQTTFTNAKISESVDK